MGERVFEAEERVGWRSLAIVEDERVDEMDGLGEAGTIDGCKGCGFELTRSRTREAEEAVGAAKEGRFDGVWCK